MTTPRPSSLPMPNRRELICAISRTPAKGLITAALEILRVADTATCAALLLDYLPDAESDADAEAIIVFLPHFRQVHKGSVFIILDDDVDPAVSRAVAEAEIDPI